MLRRVLFSPAPADSAGISQIGSAFSELERMAGQPSGDTDGAEGGGDAGDGGGQGQGEGADGEGGGEGATPEARPQPGDKGQPGEPAKPEQRQQQTAPGQQRQQQQTATGKPKARDLRSALDQSRQEVAEWKRKHDELKAQFDKPREDPRVKGLEDQVAKLTKEIERYESDVQLSAYERSKDYVERYQKPFENAYLAGANSFKTLTFSDSKGETDPITGEITGGAKRAATQQDWDKFLMLPTAEADEWAFEHLGHGATRAINMRMKVLELAEQKANAVEEHRKVGAEHTKAQTEAQRRSQQEFASRYQASLEAATKDEELARYLTAEEGDTEGAAALQKGYELADRAFGDTSNMDPQERADLYAAIRNRAAAFGYLKNVIGRLALENDQLQEKLNGYEKSEPGHDGERKGDGGGEGGDSGMDFFMRAAKKAARVG